MHLKKYLPFENYTLATRLTVDEVHKRITDNVAIKKAFRFLVFSKRPDKPYEGQITRNSFSISRIINYRNSFLPIIKGDVETFAGQTHIKIKMRPPLPVLIFISVWLSITGLVALVMTLILIAKLTRQLPPDLSPLNIIPFVMLFFGVALCYFAFNKERKIAKTFLQDLFEAEEMAAQ
jgi:hypothetical protein